MRRIPFEEVLEIKLLELKYEFPYAEVPDADYLGHFVDILYRGDLERKRDDLHNEYLKACEDIEKKKQEVLCES